MAFGKSSRKTILVADDDQAILEAIKMILEDEGYQVETATDHSTVSKVKTLQPDLVLLDIWMAGSDGGEMCRQLKQGWSTRHIPIVLISANRDTSKIAEACGADGFITKPFETNELLSMVEKFCPASP